MTVLVELNDADEDEDGDGGVDDEAHESATARAGRPTTVASGGSTTPSWLNELETGITGLVADTISSTSLGLIQFGVCGLNQRGGPLRIT